MNIPEIFKDNKILPVITVKDVNDAHRIADHLLQNKISIIEVTLRTDVALEAIKLLTRRGDITVGAGTVTSEEKFKKTVDAGAEFFVSPGISSKLTSYAKKNNLPFLPGVATPSETLQALDAGFNYLKFFPAEAAGGIKMLKSLAPVFPAAKFCPTGGLNEKNYKDYLSLENVFAAGGSWVSI